jgi:A/G-specific adenine glycosylase
VIGVPARSVAAKLLGWYDAGHRDLPWRRTTDPYRIWVSEIMLQQTRAETVIPYYERFLKRFPNATALAGASEQEVLALWSGLGYYSRARNLQRAAKLSVNGFPSSYDAIRRLPGVGEYTAAAISSIAFGLPHAVLDGNVLRVIARVTNDAADIDAPATRARFREIVRQWLDRERPGAFNQALMELGATVCLPRAPRCRICPLAAACDARRAGRHLELPVKLRRPAAVKMAAELVIVERRGRILLWKRAADSRRLAGFWELPAREQLPGLRAPRVIGTFRHTITHHHYQVTVWAGAVASAPRPLGWIAVTDLRAMPLSTTARKALRLAGVEY